MDSKRFCVISNVGIQDNLTGEIYTNHRSLCNLLNDLNDRCDGFAEELYDLRLEKLKGE